MKTVVLNGRVIYCFVTALSAEVNFSSNGEAKGFTITAKSVSNPEKIVDLFSQVKKGDGVQLTVTDGRLTNILLVGLGKNIAAADYPNLGMSLKEAAEKKVAGKFVRSMLHVADKKVLLQLCVQDAEKSIYQMEADKSQKSRMETFVRKCKKGDVLRLFQNAEGKITNVVNETQAFEFAC